MQRKIVKQEQEKVEEQKVIEYMKQKAVCNLILNMFPKNSFINNHHLM
jgi:L-cystine uptake protein TcyP (sodium:dicarboxylate symporter family)